jgi:hypothetical protein
MIDRAKNLMRPQPHGCKNLAENRFQADSAVIHSIANRRLVLQVVLATRLLPVHLSFLGFGGVDDESSLSGTSVGVDATSGHLAVRVLRNFVAGGPRSSVTWGSSRRLANALWTDAECSRD